MRLLHSSIETCAIVQPQHNLKYGSQETNRRKQIDMAYYNQTRTDSGIERLLERTAQVFHEAAAAYAKHRVYRTTLNELRALRDRELADLGMHRAALRSIALEAAERT